MARVNILRQVKTDTGWQNKPLERDPKGRLRGPSNTRFLIEWRESGRRVREAAGTTPSEALEAQKRKRLELDAKDTGLKVTDPEEEARLPLRDTLDEFLKDVKTFRKLYTRKKYTHVLEFFEEHVAPKSDLREVTPEDVKAVPRLA